MFDLAAHRAKTRFPNLGKVGMASLSNRLCFALVLLTVNLHLLRNISLGLYLAFYIPVAFLVVLQLLFKIQQGQLHRASRFFVPWLLFAFLAFIVSLFIISPVGAVTGLSRFLFAAPVFIALVVYTRNVEDFRAHISSMVMFFTVASLSLPMQLVTGPISWFAEASQRAGLERYSSLIGSLTSIGVIVGSYLVLINAMTSKLKWLLICCTILPAIVSLNKSALVNIAIALVGLVILNLRALPRVAIAGSLMVAIGLSVYSLSTVVQERVDASLQSFGISSGSATLIRDDVSFQTSALDRLIDLPVANFQALEALHSPFVYLLGGGYGMGSTALVPIVDSLAPMAHNQFAELITVFGFLGGLFLISVMVLIFLSLLRRSHGPNRVVFRSLLLAYAIFLLNSVFANGTLYQPAAASFFYLAMFAASSTAVITNAANQEVQD